MLNNAYKTTCISLSTVSFFQKDTVARYLALSYSAFQTLQKYGYYEVRPFCLTVT
jgi:hypothetical protein